MRLKDFIAELGEHHWTINKPSNYLILTRAPIRCGDLCPLEIVGLGHLGAHESAEYLSIGYPDAIIAAADNQVSSRDTNIRELRERLLKACGL